MPGVQNISNKNYIELAAVSVCLTYVVFAGKSRIIKPIVVTLSACTVTAIYVAYQIQGNKDHDSENKIQALFRGHRARILNQRAVAKIELKQKIEWALNIKNVRYLLAAYVPTPANMLLSKDWCNTFYQVMDNTVQAALQMLQFKSVKEAKEKKSPTERFSSDNASIPASELLCKLSLLGQLVAYAKKQMSTQQYQAIKQKCSNLVCRAFFTELADQIQANKDHATLALADALRRKGFSIPENTYGYFVSRADQAEAIRNWFKVPKIMENIKSVGVLCLANQGLNVLPDELSLFTGIYHLTLNNNWLTSIEGLLELKQLKFLYLRNNQLERVTLSVLTGLERLSLYDNLLKRLVGLSELKQLQMLDLSKNQIERPERAEGLSKLTQLKILGLSDNPLESVDLSWLTRLEMLSFSGKKLKGLSKLTQLQRVDSVDYFFWRP